MNAPSLPLLLWLAALAIALAGLVLLGGATRLTQSGLAITEWQPITGLLPPLTQQGWQQAFADYRAIPQFSLLWPEMTLAQFKTIYWWEWAHRFAARMIGFLFLLPFIFFWHQGFLSPRLRNFLLLVLAVGVVQAFVGWWMVQSGFAPDVVQVSHIRLAVHLGLALLIYGLVVSAFLFIRRPLFTPPAAWPLMPSLLLVLVFMQMLLGALAAGLDAGLVLNHFPALPPFAALPSPLAESGLLHDPAAIQLTHRLAAYLLCVVLLIHLALLKQHALKASALLLTLAIGGQIALGIIMIVFITPLTLALLHQAGGLLVWTLALFHFHRAMIQNGIDKHRYTA